MPWKCGVILHSEASVCQRNTVVYDAFTVGRNKLLQIFQGLLKQWKKNVRKTYTYRFVQAYLLYYNYTTLFSIMSFWFLVGTIIIIIVSLESLTAESIVFSSWVLFVYIFTRQRGKQQRTFIEFIDLLHLSQYSVSNGLPR